MYQFEYHKPASVAEAVALFNDADDPMYLSGGMTLIPTMKQRLAAPTDLIDLSGICLLYTSPSPRDLSTSRMPSSA